MLAGDHNLRIVIQEFLLSASPFEAAETSNQRTLAATSDEIVGQTPHTQTSLASSNTTERRRLEPRDAGAEITVHELHYGEMVEQHVFKIQEAHVVGVADMESTSVPLGWQESFSLGIQ